MENTQFWQVKLHARLHDPAEKALVLLRDPAGHEGGTSRSLRRAFTALADADDTRIDPDNAEVLHSALFKNGIASGIYKTVQRADWWAAAADRPQWPLQEITVQTRAGESLALKVAPWAQVRWTKSPVLIHPLTGQQIDLAQGSELAGLGDEDLASLKQRSFSHFERLVQHRGDAVDWRGTLLAYWRFGPSLREDEDNGKLGALWPLLPADTRVPDHSIWDHLDLTSAFAGAMAGDAEAEVALLTVALGPVQSFISAARSTSDLWAGSHLLARMAWEAMKPVCEALGPDAVLFPRLRGVPQVDLWLRDECGLSGALFDDNEWSSGATDANPLFAAALPNRFVAVVPRSQATALARKAESAVRGWLLRSGLEAVDRLLDVAGLAGPDEQFCHGQMRRQLKGFPEVHWAAVPFSLARPCNAARQTDLDTTALSDAMAPFFGVGPGQACGFLDSPAWKVLCDGLRWDDNTTFFAPNPGVLYPAIHELAERALAAAKAAHGFEASEQTGWRCSLTGETEWLTTDPAQLQTSYRRQTGTLWARVAAKRPAWARPGEHLGALAALKRVWPTLFAEEAGRAVGGVLGDRADRFVVSTHAMALAHPLDRWLASGAPGADAVGAEIMAQGAEPVALPRKLVRDHARHQALALAKRLPALLDAGSDAASDAEDDAGLVQRLQRLVRQTLRGSADSDARIETYYGMLLMDGDHMGAWLAGGEGFAIPYRDSFHPQVRDGFDQHAARQPLLRRYAAQARALSPNRHLAISGALNNFSLVVARHVVEVEHMGRLIYAGGDDVLAMLPVVDLLPAMHRLRVAYSGHDPAHEDGSREGLALKNGFALLKRGKAGLQLMRMMGHRATASCGAVVAHHQAPLSAVMRELHAAEKRAKTEGGRDAFSLSIVKRSGGALRVTAKFGEPLALLSDLRAFLADDGVSRRAVYNAFEWMKDLPPDAPALLRQMLGYQLARQADKAALGRHELARLAERLADLAFKTIPSDDAGRRMPWLQQFMSAAEFLARDTRSRD
jgi:CRISPR-associated protein Cmr2